MPPLTAKRSRRSPSPWSERLGLPRMDQPGTVTLFLATWIDATGSGLFFTFYLLYLTKAAGFSLGTAGLVLSIASGVSLVSNPIAGSLVDKIGPRTMAIASQIICAVGYGGLLWIEGSIPRLFIFSTLAVLGERIFWVGFPSLIAQLAPDDERDRWFAFMGMTREIGFGIGALIAAAIIALLGNDGYRVLVALNAVSFAVAAAIIWARVPTPTKPVHTGDHGGWKAVLRDRPVMKMALANTAAASTVLVGALAMPVYVVDHLELHDWVPGMLFFVTTLVLGLGQSFGLRWVAGWRRTRVYVLAAIGWTLGAIVFALAQVVPGEFLLPYVIFAIVVTVGGDLFHAPQTNGLPSALAPVALRGRYLAMFSFSWGLARTIAPGIVAALLWFGPTFPWVGMILLAGVIAAVSLNAEKELDPDRQRMPRTTRGHDMPEIVDDLIGPPITQPG